MTEGATVQVAPGGKLLKPKVTALGKVVPFIGEIWS
jgi:hypothetical protein